MLGPELGGMTLESTAPTLDEGAAWGFVRDFLDSVDPEALETSALRRVGGLEGEDSIGQCFLEALKDEAHGH
jgi:hypothetical protein